jgi:hypothetical protein
VVVDLGEATAANDVVPSSDPPPSDRTMDLVDVPAAVVCAMCGDADCAGCLEERSRSGIVSIVAWERTGVPLFSRLWSTARSTTRDAEAFFELLPDGPLAPALRFAVLCEMLAASAMVVLIVPVAAIAAPGWLSHVALDEVARSLALRLLFIGIPGLAAMLVVAHAAHGLSIDVGAARAGARSSRSRALRFGLYAAGWDLVIGPLGAVVVALKEGIVAAIGIMSLAQGLPTRCTRAFLRGSYRLEGDAAKTAIGASYVGAALATALGAFAILGALVLLVL